MVVLVVVVVVKSKLKLLSPFFLVELLSSDEVSN